MNKYIRIGGIGLIIILIGTYIAHNINPNTNSNRPQNVIEPRSIEEVGQHIIEINQQLSGLYIEKSELEEKIKKIEQEKRYWDGYIQTKLNDMGIEYNAIEEIPQGALGYMDAICKHGQIHGNTSPLCDNPHLYRKLETISRDVGVDFGLMLGIAYGESHIGANYKPAHCSYRNNWAGLKGFRKDGKTTYGKYPDNGCRIYHFKSPESFWLGFAHTLKEGYIDRGCSSPECISQYWVQNDGKVKNDWVARVRMFFENDALLAKK